MKINKFSFFFHNLIIKIDAYNKIFTSCVRKALKESKKTIETKTIFYSFIIDNIIKVDLIAREFKKLSLKKLEFVSTSMTRYCNGSSSLLSDKK